MHLRGVQVARIAQVKQVNAGFHGGQPLNDLLAGHLHAEQPALYSGKTVRADRLAGKRRLAVGRARAHDVKLSVAKAGGDFIQRRDPRGEADAAVRHAADKMHLLQRLPRQLRQFRRARAAAFVKDIDDALLHLSQHRFRLASGSYSRRGRAAHMNQQA